MRRNTYFKASLVNKRDEDALFNTFSLYIIGIIQAIVIIILQRDFNLLSITMFFVAAFIACAAAYKLGQNHR